MHIDIGFISILMGWFAAVIGFVGLAGILLFMAISCVHGVFKQFDALGIILEYAWHRKRFKKWLYEQEQLTTTKHQIDVVLSEINR